MTVLGGATRCKIFLRASRSFLKPPGPPKTSRKQTKIETKLFRDDFFLTSISLVILDIPRWLYIQFLTRNPNFRSKIGRNYSQKGKIRKNENNIKHTFSYVIFSFFSLRLSNLFIVDLKFGFLVKNCIYSQLDMLDMSRIPKPGPKLWSQILYKKSRPWIF